MMSNSEEHRMATIRISKKKKKNKGERKKGFYMAVELNAHLFGPTVC
jgi:hypothetical protein